MRYATTHGLRVSVQATGHGAAADLTGTVLVSTKAMTELDLHVSPDLQRGWVRAGAGVTWDQVLEAGAPYGLSGLAGSAPGVGVAGFTTGGGVGPLVRSLGLAADRVRAFEVVTGDGELRVVSRTEHPDLYWALRGGKGMVGIVTAVEMDLVPLPTLYGGAVYFDTADVAAVVSAWAEWQQQLPVEATTSLALLRLPGLPGVPPPLADHPTVAVRFAFTGDDATGERLLAPIRRVAEPLIDTVARMPYAALGAIHADPVDPMPSHEEHALLADFTVETAERLLAVAGPDAESPQLIVEVRQLGGAMADGAPAAFPVRDAAFGLLAIGIGVPPVVDAVVAHGSALVSALSPWTRTGRLPNFGPGDDRAWLEATYDTATIAHLERVSRAYDPDGTLAQGRMLRSPQPGH